jgi:hypothetical protein
VDHLALALLERSGEGYRRKLISMTSTFLPYEHRVKGKVVPVLLTEHHAMKAYGGSGGIAPYILDLGTRWR